MKRRALAANSEEGGAARSVAILEVTYFQGIVAAVALEAVGSATNSSFVSRQVPRRPDPSARRATVSSLILDRTETWRRPLRQPGRKTSNATGRWILCRALREELGSGDHSQYRGEPVERGAYLLLPLPGLKRRQPRRRYYGRRRPSGRAVHLPPCCWPREPRCRTQCSTRYFEAWSRSSQECQPWRHR